MIITPLIRSALLEITAEMAQPKGLRNWPSNTRMDFISFFIPKT
jgi:hypothetical protein